MRARIWAVVGAAAAVVACGGGGGSEPQQQQQPPPDTKQVYSDVWGVGVAPGAEEVPIGQWPSWLREKELLPACAAGEAFYGDRCWQSVLIDIDARSVTFTNTSGQTERLAIGASLPAILGPMVSDKVGCWGSDATQPELQGWDCLSAHHAGVGYVGMRPFMFRASGFDSEVVWGSVINGPIDAGRLSAPPTRSPWAIASQIVTKDAGVAGFLVKTTFLYGFRATKPIPLFSDFEIVHNWPLSGRVRLNGTDLSLPLRLSAVETATGTTARRMPDGSPFLDVQGRTVRFTSERDVLVARETYRGAGAGLTDPDLVTSIEFHLEPLRLP